MNGSANTGLIAADNTVRAHYQPAASGHRPRRGLPRSFYRGLSESHHALGQRHLDSRQAHLHLRRQLCLHPTQCSGPENKPGHHFVRPTFPNSFREWSTLNDDFTTTKFLQGNANRYYRAGQTGEYVQDKFQIRSNLTLTAGLRWDWDGGLTEKYGRIYNFDPSRYTYDDATDTIDPSGAGMNGFIIAGNNKLFPTKGVSNSTLTGRQWGFAPRFGVAWSPKSSTTRSSSAPGPGSTTTAANSSPIFLPALLRA